MRPEQIPHGVKDSKRIRLENFYYADKTAYIHFIDLEFVGREMRVCESVVF